MSHIDYFTELIIPFEDAIEETFERKKLKYAKLITMLARLHETSGDRCKRRCG